MNHLELQEAIEKTLEGIQALKQQIEKASDPREEKRLKRKLKELQYLQLWHIEQYEQSSN